MNTIRFVDLQKQYYSIRTQIDEVVNDVLESSSFVLGPFTEEFENNFAEAHAAKHCFAVSSGTTALYLILKALDIKKNDEVIIPVNTFIATAEAISLNNATPVFVDVDDRTYNINPSLIESSITKRTKTIIAVHLYGQPAEMEKIIGIAKKHNLYLIEDACQAHISEYGGKRIGTFGVASAFSFYPGKNLGAYGEGGAVVTNNDQLAGKIRMLRDHGSKRKYCHDIIGGNFRMSAIQAAILNVKLKLLEKWTARRSNIAYLYNHFLSEGNGIIIPYKLSYVNHVYHLYVVRVLSKNRDKVKERLLKMGIETGIHYPIPLHLQKAYEFLGYKNGAFPVAEKYAKQILSLPIYPELEDGEVELISEELNQVLNDI